MSQVTDVRKWLRENGHEVPSRGPIPAALREVYDTENPGAPMIIDPPAREEGGEHTPVAAPPPDTSKQSDPVARVKGWARQRQGAKPDRPRTTRRRASTEALFAGVWQYGAQVLAVRRELVPMARVMTLQAPVAGVVVEGAVKGTAIDRMVQPLARLSEKGTELSALFGPPLIVYAISQQPQLYGVLYQPLYSSLVSWVKVAAPALKKKRLEMEKLQAEMQELGEEFGVEAEGDFIKAMIEGFFAPLPDLQETASE